MYIAYHLYILSQIQVYELFGLVQLGNIYCNKLQYKKVIPLFNKSIKILKTKAINDNNILKNQIYMRLGYMWTTLGNLNGAREEFLKAKELSILSSDNQEEHLLSHFQLVNIEDENNKWKFLSNIYDQVDKENFYEVALIYKELLDHFENDNNAWYISKIVTFLKARQCYTDIIDIYFILNNI